MTVRILTTGLRSSEAGWEVEAMNTLKARASRGFLFLAIVMGLLLFVPTGTVQYWQAWAYLAVYFGASLLITVYLAKNDPALLERRLRGGPAAEKEKTQKVVMLITSMGFVASLVVPALDHRFKWSIVPPFVVIAGDILTALWFYIMFLAFRVNTFTSATIEIAEDQKVIDTGLYAMIRHPMYAGGLLLFIGTPLALGSFWGLLAFVAVVPAIIWRLLNEEKLLAKDLPGYIDYCAKVRWRLVPGVF
jgi:protein-S-isoprenylcysteine O-methyltransferase Ste14